MKNLIVIAALLISVAGYSRTPVGKVIDTSVVDLDNTYAGSENEFIPGGTTSVSNIIVVNPSAVDIYGCFQSLTAGDCTDEFVIPANSFRRKRSDYIRGLYLRASTGTISSGAILEGTGE